MSWCIHRKYRFEVRNEHTSNIAERIRCPTVGVLGYSPKSLGRFIKDGNTGLVDAVFESELATAYATICVQNQLHSRSSPVLSTVSIIHMKVYMGVRL